MMKVLICTGWYPNPIYREDGLSVRNQALMLSQAGLDVSVVSISLTGQWLAKGLFRNRCRKTDYHSVPEFRLEGPFPKKRIGWLWRRYNKAAQKMLLSVINNHGRPDVIHLHNHMIGPAALHVSQSLSIPLVYTEHSTALMSNGLPPAQRQFLPSLASHAYSAGVSSALARAMQLQTGTTIEVLPNFIDTDIFYFDGSSPQREGIHLITVSVLILRKQIDLLLHIFADVVDHFPTATLTIVGYGPEEENLRQLVHSLGLVESVHFTGPLDQVAVAEALRAADLFVSASKLETFGVMYVEALACGLPVVALDSGGVRDIVQSPELGIVLSDMDEFQQGLVKVMSDFSRYDRKYISRWVHQHFGKAAIVDRHRYIYQSLLASGV